MIHSLFRAPTEFDGCAYQRRRSDKTMRLELPLRLGVAGLMAFLIGCNSKTVFQSSFDPNTVGAAPSLTQATGTINVSGTPGSVLIVPAPAAASGNWAQIQRAAGPTAPISAMQCDFSPYQRNGTYSTTVVLFIPSGSGLVSLEFDTAPQAGPPSQGFLHLDFGDFPADKPVHKNTVRINDDDTQLFGTFPRDQFFTVTVGLDINSSSAMAHANLFGTGASGAKDFNVVTSTFPLSLAEQFGAITFFMGSPWGGSFDATNIIVTRK
jgi:hypothetical protein